MGKEISITNDLYLKTDNILIVDDLPDNLQLLSNILTEQCYEVRAARSGVIAIEAIKNELPDLILLDIRMPDMDGFEVCRRLKLDEKARDVPIIFISASGETADKTKAFQMGGVDYITKPFQESEILARVKTHLNIRRLQKEHEHYRYFLEGRISKSTTELTKSENRFNDLVEDLPVGIFRTAVDTDGRIKMANTAIARMFGYNTVEDIEGVQTSELYCNPDQNSRVMELLVSDGNIHGLELDLKTRDGKIIIGSVSAHIIRDENGHPLYIDGIIEDITEQKTLKEHFRQAQKMEAIGILAGGIAHDFNNILSAILGFSELVKLDFYQGEDIINNIDEVIKAGCRARELVNQILLFSRRADVKRDPLNVPLHLKETIRFLRASLPATIEIRQNIAAKDCSVKADPTQLHQILMNLCTNAAHAMKEKGGHMDIQLDEMKLDEDKHPEYKELIPGAYVRLTVKDTGHGIEPEIIERIFEPFFTSKIRGEGTGMGLSVVHGIVNDMGGFISVSSEIDKGTTFHVLLPKHEDKVIDAPTSSEIMEKGKGKILFVDDEQCIIEANSKILQEIGYEVETTASGFEALERFKSDSNRFDLVLTDMTMPRMTGLELSKKLKKIKPDIPVILCSGFSSDVTPEMINESGIFAMVKKPMLSNELAEVVKKALKNNKFEEATG